MPPSVHRSTANKSLIVVSCILSLGVPMPSLGQHAIARPAGGVVHTSAPPIPHISISPAPIIHRPISTPRMPIASSAGGPLGKVGLRPPRRPIRPFPPAFVLYESPAFLGGPFSRWNSCWWGSCDLFWPWLGYTTVSSPVPISDVYQPYPTPGYVYGEEREDLPQLFLKDGTVLNVTDYWLVDDQLHFRMIEEEGGKPAEHVIPFDALDLQRTVEVNTGSGFRFMLRNEPFEEYVRDHPEGPPPVITPPHQ